MLKVAEKFRSVLRRKGIRDSPGPAGAGSPVGELTYMLNSKKITEYLTPGHHVHLVGIGGVSMRPLGLVLKGMGMEVTGSDMNASVSTDELIEQGIPVAIGHRAENIEGADCIIRTAAAHNDNPEIAAARAAGIPVFERAQAWGEIMKSYHNAICVSGTHGKTTTTSMVTHILMEADMDPTVMIGGYLPLLHAGHRVGHGDTIVLESCEYCDSFLNFFPTLAIVLNVEADHLDYFKDLADIQKSFHKFASLATFGVVANGDDPHTVQAIEYDELAGTLVAYSLGDFFGDASRGGTNYSIILDLEITKDSSTGTTKVTNYSYTPIYTVSEAESADGYRRVVRIDKTVEAWEENYLDKVSQSAKESMVYALDRIKARINPPVVEKKK